MKKQLIAKNVIIKMDIIMSKEKQIPYVEALKKHPACTLKKGKPEK